MNDLKSKIVVTALMLTFSVIGCGPAMEAEEQATEPAQTEQAVMWGYSVKPCPCTSYKIGTVMEADWSARSGHSTSDWVGIFGVGSSQYSYVSWAYVGTTATSGKVRLSLPVNMYPGAQYELRYYLNDGFQLAAISPPFTVTN